MATKDNGGWVFGGPAASEDAHFLPTGLPLPLCGKPRAAAEWLPAPSWAAPHCITCEQALAAITQEEEAHG